MTNEPHIILDKELRRDIDAIITRLRISANMPQPSSRALPICPNCESNRLVELSQFPEEGQYFCACNSPGPRCFTPRASRERSIVITKLQEAVMWLGMDLKAINDENPGTVENPYPHSKDPSNTVIDKTADGLKL